MNWEWLFYQYFLRLLLESLELESTQPVPETERVIAPRIDGPIVDQGVQRPRTSNRWRRPAERAMFISVDEEVWSLGDDPRTPAPPLPLRRGAPVVSLKRYWQFFGPFNQKDYRIADTERINNTDPFSPINMVAWTDEYKFDGGWPLLAGEHLIFHSIRHDLTVPPDILGNHPTDITFVKTNQWFDDDNFQILEYVAAGATIVFNSGGEPSDMALAVGTRRIWLGAHATVTDPNYLETPNAQPQIARITARLAWVNEDLSNPYSSYVTVDLGFTPPPHGTTDAEAWFYFPNRYDEDGNLLEAWRIERLQGTDERRWQPRGTNVVTAYIETTDQYVILWEQGYEVSAGVTQTPKIDMGFDSEKAANFDEALWIGSGRPTDPVPMSGFVIDDTKEAAWDYTVIRDDPVPASFDRRKRVVFNATTGAFVSESDFTGNLPFFMYQLGHGGMIARFLLFNVALGTVGVVLDLMQVDMATGETLERVSLLEEAGMSGDYSLDFVSFNELNGAYLIQLNRPSDSTCVSFEIRFTEAYPSLEHTLKVHGNVSSVLAGGQFARRGVWIKR